MPDNELTKIAQTPAHMNAALVLANGGVFFGQGVGAEGITVGEICFNTSMTGYQEILTDPSYAQQVITFTFPHIGNTGTNEEDVESKKPFAAGLILRDKITDPSSFRSQMHFNDWLIKNKLTGICGVDTRAVTRNIRENGAQNVGICFYKDKSKIDLEAVRKKVDQHPGMKGLELAKTVTCDKPYKWQQTGWKLGRGYGTQKNPRYKVVAVDFGAKLNILRCLAEIGCDVTVVPADTGAKEILAQNPDGVFLSNGPGDPAATGKYATPMIKGIIDSGVPLFGICLGHQLLALALGCETDKMHQGHRGANHPVYNMEKNNVEITSQNHGFVVMRDKLGEGVIETHISLFDETLEGLRLEGKPVFSVQHHPEASPGPHDSHYLFEQFLKLMEEFRVQSSEFSKKKQG